MPSTRRLLRKQLHCLVDQLTDADLDTVYQLLAVLIQEETFRPTDQRVLDELRQRLAAPAPVR